MKKLLVYILIVLFAFSLYADRYSREIAKTEKKLKQLKARLIKVQRKYKELKSQEQEIMKMIDAIDEEMSLTYKFLYQMKKKEKLMERKIKYLKMEKDYLENQLEYRKKILNKRLRSIYKQTNSSVLEIFLTSQSFSDVYTQIKYMGMIAEQDKRIAREIENLKKKIELKEKVLNVSLQELDELKSQLEQEYKTLEQEKKEKRTLLKNIQTQKDKQKKLEKEIIQSQKNLQVMINKLIEKRKKELEQNKNILNISGKEFAKNKGKLPWPTNGKLIRKFGTVMHEKYATKTKNNGIDIKATIGTPVYSVASGTVIYADRFLGYGNMILIDHGNGYYTMYSHLKDIDVEVNETVSTYEKIGTVGETGSLSGPMLHFEIRKDGKAINPLPWLRKK